MIIEIADRLPETKNIHWPRHRVMARPQGFSMGVTFPRHNTEKRRLGGGNK